MYLCDKNITYLGIRGTNAPHNQESYNLQSLLSVCGSFIHTVAHLQIQSTLDLVVPQYLLVKKSACIMDPHSSNLRCSRVNCTYLYGYIHINVWYIHLYIYTHTHTHVCVCVCVSEIFLKKYCPQCQSRTQNLD